MRIISKRIKVIQMTEEEITVFKRTMDRAAEGHTSHYAEEQLEDGGYLGVQVVPYTPPEPRRNRAQYSENNF